MATESDEAVTKHLAPNFNGPYKVIRHTKNDVECRHLVMKNVCVFVVSRVTKFHGSEQDDDEAAKIDADQANIVANYNWRNSSTEDMFMEFLIELDNRAPEWIPWSADLNASVLYGEYVIRKGRCFCVEQRRRWLINSAHRSTSNLSGMSSQLIWYKSTYESLVKHELTSGSFLEHSIVSMYWLSRTHRGNAATS